MDYQKELFAQCTPYLQWLKEQEPVTGSDGNDTGKPLDVFPFSSCEDSVGDVLGGSADRERIYLFVNADGVLRERARARIVRVFLKYRDVAVVYADEDYFGTLEKLYHVEEQMFDNAVLEPFREPSNGLFRGDAWFKPDFSPDTLNAFFYIGNIFAINGCRLAEVTDAYGMDISLCVLVQELARRAITRDGSLCAQHPHGKGMFVHIPEVLYTNNQRGQGDASDRRQQDGGVQHIGGKQANLGKLSVIIPSKDNPKLLKRCVETFAASAKDADYELIVVDNGSTDENRTRIEVFLTAYHAKYLYEKKEFNFSQMCNLGEKAADGDFLLFLNDDIEVGKAQQDGQWLHKMMRYAAMAHVGAVGIKLHYPDGNLIQHAGITNMGIGPAHKLGGMPDEGSLYHGHNLADCDMLAVTAACMMVSREKFERAGGFDEGFAVAYNDVELCFRLYRMGLYNVQVNSFFLIHHESVSRGADTAPEKQGRLLQEKRKLYGKHAWAMSQAGGIDPFYSPNLVQWEKDTAYHVNYQYPCDRVATLKPLTGEAYQGFRALLRREKFRQKLTRTNAFIAGLYHKLTGAGRHMYHLDSIMQEDGIVTVAGWHVLRQCDNAKIEKTLCLYNANGAYGAELYPKLRGDVEALFVNEADRTRNTALSGICLKFDTAQLPKGNYAVGLVAEYRGRRQLVCLQEQFGLK